MIFLAYLLSPGLKAKQWIGVSRILCNQKTRFTVVVINLSRQSAKVIVSIFPSSFSYSTEVEEYLGPTLMLIII